MAAFDTYLTSLEAQLPPFTKSQHASALMTQLRPKLQEAIICVGTLPRRTDSTVAQGQEGEPEVERIQLKVKTKV